MPSSVLIASTIKFVSSKYTSGQIRTYLLARFFAIVNLCSRQIPMTAAVTKSSQSDDEAGNCGTKRKRKVR